MDRPTIVFDLDGTLVDTAPDLLDSLNHTLGAGGATPSDVTGFRQFVGHGARVLIERAYHAQRRPLPVHEHDRLFALFLEHYGANIPGQSKPFPGVVEALDRFRAAGYLLAVCTNKTEDFSRRLLVGLGMSGYFEAICGQDTFAFRKPDPRHLTETIRLAGGMPETSVMVGDSRTDIDTAKAAGIPVVAVDFGYTDRHVREFEPSIVISHFEELTVALAERLIASVQG
ncbi:MAG: phosphoglycolate phosphatase [Mesorhizobium sp.]|nr:phosphoglycolate phosphatase [Mesorhizobium sp.]